MLSHANYFHHFALRWCSLTSHDPSAHTRARFPFGILCVGDLHEYGDVSIAYSSYIQSIQDLNSLYFTRLHQVHNESKRMWIGSLRLTFSTVDAGALPL